MIKEKLAAFIAILMLLSNAVAAQSQEKAYALLMLNFIKGIQWPDHAGKEKFVLGVLEYPPLAVELTAAIKSGKAGRQIEIREFDSADEVSKCHMLFIPAYKAKQLGPLTGKMGSAPTLLVTNKFDLARKGSHINFVIVDGKLRYEINCKSIEQRGMKIASNIKGLGIIVEN
jgi:hypothetical protein